MASRLTAVTPERLEEVLSFLREVYGLGLDAPGFQPALARWKFFAPHPFWQGPRSFVLDHDGAIHAHGCISPARFQAFGHRLESGQVLDWAGSRRLPGSGLLLYRECLNYAGALFAPGGSDDTRNVVARSKMFRKVCDEHLFARPLHPLRALGVSPERGLKRFLKTARRAAWRFWPPLQGAGDWRCVPVKKLEQVWTPAATAVVIERTPEWLNYFLECPAVRFQALILEQGGQPQGHTLVSFAGPQLRIADIAIGSNDQKDWISALAGVVQWAARQAGVAEIVGASSLNLLRRTYLGAGFRPRGAWEVYFADPQKLIPEGPEVEANLLLGDASWALDRVTPFWS